MSNNELIVVYDKRISKTYIFKNEAVFNEWKSKYCFTANSLIHIMLDNTLEDDKTNQTILDGIEYLIVPLKIFIDKIKVAIIKTEKNI